MPDTFITDDFLLQNEPARRLYHDYARDLPIVDYHCHLPPQQVAEDHRFANLTQIWLYGDHYKWRAMRAAGVAEQFCTGDASDREKFAKWAETVPKTLRNPLYHWTHLELNRPFGIRDRLLSPATAEGIWEACNARLAEDGFSCRGIMRQMNVALVCTTDDPVDSLEHHRAIAADPSFSDPRAAHLSARQGPGHRLAAGLERLAGPAARRRLDVDVISYRLAAGRAAASVTTSSMPAAAAFPTTGWRRSTATTAREAEIGGHLSQTRAAKPLRRAEQHASSRPCSTNWP